MSAQGREQSRQRLDWQAQRRRSGRQQLEQKTPPLSGLLPKSTVNRQLEALPANLPAGHLSSLSSLSTLTSSLTSQEREGPCRVRNHVLWTASSKLGAKVQGPIFGGTEVLWGLIRCQIPGMLWPRPPIQPQVLCLSCHSSII